MELIKKQIHCNKIGKNIIDQFYVDEDINVPDSKGDVSRIVEGEGKIRIDEIKHVENYLRVIGKLFYQILYVTEEGEPHLAAIEGKLPIEEMIYVEGEDAERCYIKNTRVEFQTSLIHSRKISMKTMVELEISREEIRDEETTVDVEGSNTLFKKYKPINILQMHTCKNDTYRIKEEMKIPGTKENIGTLLMTKMDCRKLDSKLVQDELLVNGEIQIFCMYMSDECKEDWVEQSIPFEGRVECYGVEESMYHYVTSTLEDIMVDVRMDEDGEMRILGIEGTLQMRIQIYEEEDIEILEDMYSLESECELEKREAVYEEMLLRNQSKCKVSEQLSLPELKDDILQICHSDGVVQVEHTEVVDGGVQIEGILHISFLYVKANDEVPFDTWQGMVPFTHLLEGTDVNQEICIDIHSSLEQLSITLAGSDDVEIKAVLVFNSFLRKPINVDVITDVTLLPYSAEEAQKRPGIVGYIVKENDDLWNLAKRFYTTMDGIREVNNLGEKELKCGDRILIFKENMSIL